jgi:hypothetical protein
MRVWHQVQEAAAQIRFGNSSGPANFPNLGRDPSVGLWRLFKCHCSVPVRLDKKDKSYALATFSFGS